MKLSAFNLFRLIVVAILVAIAAVLVIRAYYRHLQIQEYKDRNIYEIVAMNPKKEEGKTRLTAYYMICEPGGSLEEVKAQIAALSKELAALRKEVVLCNRIAERSGVIQEKIKAVREDEQIKEKEKTCNLNWCLFALPKAGQLVNCRKTKNSLICGWICRWHRCR